MQAIKISKPFWVFCYLLISFASHSQNLDSILHRYYSKTGGIENWKNLKGIIIKYSSSSLKDMIHVNNLSNRLVKSSGFKINAKKGSILMEKWITVEQNRSDTFATCYNGKDYWVHKKWEAPESFTYYANHYGRHVRMSDPLFLFQSDSIQLDGIRKLEFGNTINECYRLKVFVDGSEWHYFINTKTYLPEASSDSFETRITYYFNYKFLNGLLFPYKEMTMKSNILVMESECTGIELNPKVPDSEFDYPKDYNIILNNQFK